MRRSTSLLFAATLSCFAACGGGGDEPTPTDAAAPVTMDGCTKLGIKSVAEVETKLIVMRCGVGSGGNQCHSGTFPPRLDNMGGTQIMTQIVNKKPGLLCQRDLYINVAAPAKSFVLAKINSPMNAVTCPSSGSGGDKMPWQSGNPVPKALSADELSCLTWYVYNVGH
jgi:hypothetical protein